MYELFVRKFGSSFLTTRGLLRPSRPWRDAWLQALHQQLVTKTYIISTKWRQPLTSVSGGMPLLSVEHYSSWSWVWFRNGVVHSTKKTGICGVNLLKGQSRFKLFEQWPSGQFAKALERSPLDCDVFCVGVARRRHRLRRLGKGDRSQHHRRLIV